MKTLLWVCKDYTDMFPIYNWETEFKLTGRLKYQKREGKEAKMWVEVTYNILTPKTTKIWQVWRWFSNYERKVTEFVLDDRIVIKHDRIIVDCSND